MVSCLIATFNYDAYSLREKEEDESGVDFLERRIVE